jgi:hypothetical protein
MKSRKGGKRYVHREWDSRCLLSLPSSLSSPSSSHPPHRSPLYLFLMHPLPPKYLSLSRETSSYRGARGATLLSPTNSQSPFNPLAREGRKKKRIREGRTTRRHGGGNSRRNITCNFMTLG